MDWPILFQQLKQAGVRPGYPAGQVGKWTFQEIADRCDVSLRLVNLWAKGEQRCQNIEQLASIFAYRASPTYEDIIFVHDRHFGFEDQYVFLTRISTVHGFWDEALRESQMDDVSYQRLDGTTTDEVAHLINFFEPKVPIDDARTIAVLARRKIYYIKYGSRTIASDARHRKDIREFNQELEELLDSLGFPLRAERKINKSLVCVGIGCGHEGVGIYDRFQRFVGVDISSKALEAAASVFPNSVEMLRNDAEARWVVPDGPFDLYVSLKTYQSSFFDIPKAVEQCARLLVRNGIAVISIPRGYYKEAEGGWELTEGLSRSLYNLQAAVDYGTYILPEKKYVIELLGKIAGELYRCQFKEVMIHTGIHEHYVYAIRG